jgi:hypothetical protein
MSELIGNRWSQELKFNIDKITNKLNTSQVYFNPFNQVTLWAC